MQEVFYRVLELLHYALEYPRNLVGFAVHLFAPSSQLLSLVTTEYRKLGRLAHPSNAFVLCIRRRHPLSHSFHSELTGYLSSHLIKCVSTPSSASVVLSHQRIFDNLRSICKLSDAIFPGFFYYLLNVYIICRI